jgi:competence protein ComGC
MPKKINKYLVISICLVIVVIVVLVVVLVVKNINKNSNTLSASQQTAAKQLIDTNWQQFFAASTSLQGRENLLQKGSSYSQYIQAEFFGLAAQKSYTVVNSVSFVNKTKADVDYTVYLNSRPLLSGEKGQALLIGNSWKVSDGTLCHLLNFGANTPAACKNLAY